MSYIFFQNNPCQRTAGDCAVRAISCVLNIDWDDAYMLLANEGYRMCEMPSGNAVWGSVLRQNGFKRFVMAETNKTYTIKKFAQDHSKGVYVVCTGTHVVPIVDGYYFDSWDSGNEIPEYYWCQA